MSVIRTQIRVKCSDVAANALLTDWAVIDLTPEFSLRLSKDVEALTDVNELLTDGILPFSVPFSTTNDLVFSRYGSPIIFNPTNDGIEARVHVDGHELPFDMIFFREKDNNRKSWEMEFRRSPNHWLELASEKKLCTIEAGSFTLNEANVIAGWAQPKFDAAGAVTSIVRWWPADYGGWVDLKEQVQFTDPPVKGVWVEDLRPFFSVPELLRLGFCEIGWTLEGLVFETPWATALWDYILKRDYYAESRGGTAILNLRNVTADQEFLSIIPTVKMTAVDYDPGTNALGDGSGNYWAAIDAPLPFICNYKYCFRGFIENTTGADVTIDAAVIECTISGASASNFGATLTVPNQPQNLVIIPAGDTAFVDVCVLARMEPGQTGLFLFGSAATAGVFAKKGYRVTIQPDTQSLIRGDVVDLKRLIDCDYFLLDRFKGFLQLINGRVETNWNTKTITVYPQRTADVFGDSTPGFIDESDVIDLTGMVVCDSAKQIPVKNELKRYTRLQFAESTDALITDLDPLEPYHSRKILNGLDLPDQIETRENPFWEPTIERQSTVLAKVFDVSSFPLPTLTVYDSPYLPAMLDNLDGNRSFNILPRILFAYGVVGQVGTSTSSGGFTGLYFEGDTKTEIGYASQVRTLELSASFPPHLDGSVVFGVKPSDLYVTFYIGLSQANTRGRWVDLLVLMGMNEWNAWNFRKQFLFNYEGRPVIGSGQNIRDFAPAANLPTPLRVLVEPNTSDCCDGPCSCVYRTCNMFQDFGQFMSQQTLDSLSITSFKVNDIEQLSAPVDFGIINVVSINGKAFVTNLIDALNDIAIPYFDFSPSQLDYPEKTDWRFFKMKYPACFTFEIIISTETEVYKYTDTETLQKWFDVSWTAFGYSGNPIGTPQDCELTTEY